MLFGAASRGFPSFGDSAFKKPVKFATLNAVTPLPANTMAPAAGVSFGQTLTANANGALNAAAAWNGVTIATPIVVGDRVLVRGEASPKNGIWIVTSIGAVGSKWKLTRATDADTTTELPVGAFVIDNLLGDAESGGLAAGIYVRTDATNDVWDMLPQVVNPFFTTSAEQIFLAANTRITGADGTGAGNPTALNVTGAETLDTLYVDTIILNTTNLDVRLRRTATKTLTIDDGAGGPALLNMPLTNSDTAFTITGGGSATYTAKWAKYLQIGNAIFFEIGWTVNAGGSGATPLSIQSDDTGLPSPDHAFSLVGDRGGAGVTRIIARFIASISELHITNIATISAPGTTLTGADLVNGATYSFAGSYLVA